MQAEIVHKLRKGEFFLDIENTGGNIISFSHKFETNYIFFPRMERNDGKIRGGSHICFPYFGSKVGEKGNHGFGRSSKPISVENGSLEYMQINFEDFKLSFEMTDNGFIQTLECSDPEKFIVFNPGFHPYFFIPTSVVGGLREGKVVFLSSKGLGRHYIDFANISKKSQIYEVAPYSEISIVLDHGEFNIRFETSEPIRNEISFALCLWREENSWLCVEPIFSHPKSPANITKKVFWMKMNIEFYPSY